MARVVVVEDEAQVLLLAESVLQEAGHETLIASTVAEAQALINDPDQKFDLVFTDITLSNHKEGGVTIGKLVAQARQGTPVLYTSARPLTDGLQSLFVEPSAYLAKPYTAPELTEAVAKLLKE